jgi:hypothetical protein
MWTGLITLTVVYMLGCCEHGKEQSGSIRARVFLD